MAESFPTTPAVGDKVTASWADIVAADAVIVDSGAAVITPVANTPTSLAITFNKVFPSAPVVLVTPNTTVPGTTVTGWSVSGITTTGCTLWVTRTNTSGTSLIWLAVLSH